MRKTSKILLSALAVSSMFFTMTVNAEELTPTTSENQNITVAQETTKTVSNLTQEELNTIIPNEIEISTTKTDIANHFANAYDNPDAEHPAEIALKEKIISIFSTNGYTINTSDFSVTALITNWEEGFVEFSSLKIQKEFTIKYTKESGYSEQDATYVKNKVDSIKFANYEGNDAVFTMYNIGDEANANKWTRDTFDFAKLLNDNSITIKKSTSFGGQGGGTPWGEGHDLYFYKNGVLYATKPIMNLGAYGTTLENGTPVNMARLETDDEIYKAMAKELESKGFKNILGCYELTAYGTTTNNMKVSFNLGNNYNGKEVQILHKKKDNTYEIFKTTVADGKAEITVSEFSPFMIALSDNSTTTENVNKAPNNAQTSSIDVVLYSILALGSLVGITYILVSKKKKEIA